MTDWWCFLCLGELCAHGQAAGNGLRHPEPGNQVRAVTAYMGTPCCASCALGVAKRIAAREREVLAGHCEGRPA